MCPVLAIYGKEDILGYINGTLEDAEEEQDIESLVENDPRAAEIVCNLSNTYLGDHKTFDADAQKRLEKLRKIAVRTNHMA